MVSTQKQIEPGKKFLRIIIFYGLGLILKLTKIPLNTNCEL